MNIKSLLIALSISSVSLSAADICNDLNEASPLMRFIIESPNRLNSDVKSLVQDYILRKKSIYDLNNFVKFLQTEIYELVDAEKIEEAQARFDSVTLVLDALYEGMDDVVRWRAGEETLGLIDRYLDDHLQLAQEYSTIINTSPVEQ